MQRAGARFERAPAVVTHEGAAFRAADKVDISSAARARAAAPGSSSLEEALVDERIAGHAYRANLKTLQTADEMTNELLRLR
jgi:flagellar hook protein FlgE